MLTMCVSDPSEAIPVINMVIQCFEKKFRFGRVKKLHKDICKALVSRPHGRAFQYGRRLGKGSVTCVSVQWYRWRKMTWIACDMYRETLVPGDRRSVYFRDDKWLALFNVNQSLYGMRKFALSRYFERRLRRMGIPVPDDCGRIIGVTVPQTVGTRRFAIVRYSEPSLRENFFCDALVLRVDVIFDCGLRVPVGNKLSDESVSRMLHFYWLPQAPEWVEVACGLGLVELRFEPIDADRAHDRVKAIGGASCRCDRGQR